MLCSYHYHHIVFCVVLLGREPFCHVNLVDGKKKRLASQRAALEKEEHVRRVIFALAIA
jgi:hypothetical protein